MAETNTDFGDDHLVVHLDAAGPFDLGEFQESLAALSRIYARHHGTEATESPQARLYVTRITSGSIELEIVPLLALLGMPIAFMDTALIIREFSSWLGQSLKAAAEPTIPAKRLSRDEAKDLEAFVAPLTGRRGAKLGIVHAKLHRKEKGILSERELIAEYRLDEGAINRAAANLQRLTDTSEKQATPQNRTVREVLMVFQQADKTPGKAKGRTGDRVIISAVTDRPLPVYFPSEASAIKRRILEQTENPFSMGYVVDAIVQYAGDDIPKLYSVIDLHDTVPLD